MPIIFTQPKRVIDLRLRRSPRSLRKPYVHIWEQGFDKGYKIGYNQALKDMKSCIKTSQKKSTK